MTIKDITEGYFSKSPEEKQEIIKQVLEVYINDMIEQGGNLLILRTHLMLQKENNFRNEEYEICEVLQQCIDGLTEILDDIHRIIREEDGEVIE